MALRGVCSGRNWEEACESLTGGGGSAGGGTAHEVFQGLVLVMVVNQQHLLDGVALEPHLAKARHQLQEL